MDDIVYKGLGESNICQMFKEHHNVFWIKKGRDEKSWNTFLLTKNVKFNPQEESTLYCISCNVREKPRHYEQMV